MAGLAHELKNPLVERGPVPAIHYLLPRLLRIQQMALPPGIRIRHTFQWTGQIPAHPLKVEQIMLNLVANAAHAIRHTERKEGTIEITVRRKGAHALLEVADHGPGIPPPLLATLFQAFVTTKPEGEGTGLGLAISRRLARSMGGDLRAENREEGGARFILELPSGPRSERDMAPPKGPTGTVAGAAPVQ